MFTEKPGQDKYLQYLREREALNREREEKEYLKEKLHREQSERFWGSITGAKPGKTGNLRDIPQTVTLKEKGLKDVPKLFRR